MARDQFDDDPTGAYAEEKRKAAAAEAHRQAGGDSGRDQVTPHGPGVVDRGAFNYGGDPYKAKRDADALAAEAAAAQGRRGESISTNLADQMRGAANQARGSQLGMADMMRARAEGRTPSIAGMRADQDMRRVAAEGTSAAAGARGPAALALAQQGAAANTAANQSAISNSAQINSAQERMQAEQAAMGAYTGIRGGDQAQQGQDFSQSAAQAQLNAAQRAQNDAYATNTRQQGIGINTTQLGADMNRDAAEQAGHFNAMAAQANRDRDDDANMVGYVSAGASTAAAVAPMVASDEETKVPVTWGSDAAAGSPAGAPTSTWGTGTGTTGFDMSKMIARRALDQQTDRENASAMTGMGPQAHAGMQALKDRDAEELGLIGAKKRNGVDLTAKEQGSEASLRHRAGMDRLNATMDKAEGKHAQAKASFGEQAGAAGAGALSGLGKVFGQMSAGKRSQEAWKPTAASQHTLPPMQTTSDDHAKVAVAQRDAFRAGMNHASAAADTGEFGEVPDYMQNEGAGFRNASVVKGQPPKETRRAASTKVDRDEGRKAEQARGLTRMEGDNAGAHGDLATGALLGPLGAGQMAMGANALRENDALNEGRKREGSMAPPKDAEVPGLWQSMVARMQSDEDTKVAPLRDEQDGRGEQHYDRDVSKSKASSGGASLSGPTPKYSTARNADPPARKRVDSAPASRKMTNAELERYGRELQGSVQTQSGAQLADGPAIDASKPRGAIRAGNINHYGRPEVDNHDGTTSTVRSMSFNDGPGREVLIPTAYDGAVHSEDDSIRNYRKTGQHMGVFRTPDHATDHAENVHNDYAAGKYKREQVGSLGKEMPRDDMAEAARSMRSVPYAYKEQFAGQEGQAPGEVNIGPVAQEMQKSPVAATAVKQESPDAMRAIDIPKFTKVLGGIAASQQEEIDEMKSFMARRFGRARR